jgi:hypothetical protein
MHMPLVSMFLCGEHVLVEVFVSSFFMDRAISSKVKRTCKICNIVNGQCRGLVIFTKLNIRKRK